MVAYKHLPTLSDAYDAGELHPVPSEEQLYEGRKEINDIISLWCVLVLAVRKRGKGLVRSFIQSSHPQAGRHHRARSRWYTWVLNP